jgi:hypothetical protein
MFKKKWLYCSPWEDSSNILCIIKLSVYYSNIVSNTALASYGSMPFEERDEMEMWIAYWTTYERASRDPQFAFPGRARPM